MKIAACVKSSALCRLYKPYIYVVSSDPMKGIIIDLEFSHSNASFNVCFIRKK